MSALNISRGDVVGPQGVTASLVVIGADAVAQPGPRDLAILLDLSGSLGGPPRRHALACLDMVLAGLHDGRRCTVAVAGSAPRLLVALAPVEGVRESVRPRAAQAGYAGPGTLARACELLRLELAREGAPAHVLVISDLAWRPEVNEALAGLEASGHAITAAEVTSAFTPATPARAPRVKVPPTLEPEGTTALTEAVLALKALLRLDVPPPPSGSLQVELDRAPLAWFAGDPLEAGARFAERSVRVPLVRGAARIAFTTRARARELGRATLEIAGSAPEAVAISLETASALSGDPSASLAQELLRGALEVS